MLKEMLKKAKYNNSKRKSSSRTKTKVEPIPTELITVQSKLNELFSDTNDFIIKTITLQNNSNTAVLITYIEGMADLKLLNENILKPIMEKSIDINFENESSDNKNIINILKDNIFTCSEISETNDFNQTIKNILSGDIIVYIDGASTALNITLHGVKSRNISEPLTDVVVRGPREGFTELLQTNKSMIRRKIKNTNLKFEHLTIGTQTATTVALCYIKGIADENVLNTLRKKLLEIDIDAILESGYLEAFIDNAPLSIFPTVGSTERPDVVSGKLLEGKVAILCDGTPFVLTVPFLLVEALQSSEDYYVGSVISSFSRLIRFIGLLISVNLPAIYLSLICFHQEVIPFKLLITMASSRERVPYVAFTEAFFMLFTFEILREAGIRMPRPVGSTVSIVGALVLGQSAVQAGLVSTPMVIVTAITAISGSLINPLSGTIPILRVIILIAANTVGFLGILIVNIALLIHLSTIRSFDIPYLSPFSPLDGTDLKDSLIRVPLWALFKRPNTLIRGRRDKLKYREKP